MRKMMRGDGKGAGVREHRLEASLMAGRTGVAALVPTIEELAG